MIYSLNNQQIAAPKEILHIAEKKAVQKKPSVIIEKIIKAFLGIDFFYSCLDLLCSDFFIKFRTVQDKKAMSPLALRKFDEMEKQIQILAKQVGIVKSHKIHLNLNFYVKKSILSGAATFSFIGLPYLLIAPSKEDLPAHLNLDRLNAHEIDERTWALEYYQWHTTEFFKLEFFPIDQMTQNEQDEIISLGKQQIQAFKDPDHFQKKLHAIIGHELGHMYYSHVLKRILLRCFWNLLGIPTFGLSSLFEERVFKPLYHRQEKEADLFSAKHLPEAKKALIDMFEERVAPSLDWKHPSPAARIRNLQAN